MPEWRTATIGEIAEVFDGPHATPKRTDAGPWFLNIGSLRAGRLDLSESAHISEADFATWTRRVTPMAGDVLFSYETRLGEAALMPADLRACLGRRMGLLRPRPGKIDSRFLLYAYLAPSFQEVIRQRKIHGATVDRIPLNELPDWPIVLPSLSDQQAIAALLGALDDKIAINDRICRSYEELLSARFHRLQIDIESGPADGIPASELVEFNPQTPVVHSKDAVFLDIAAVPTNSARVHKWTRREPKPGVRFMNNDTVMARITPCLENGKVAFVDFMNDGEVGVGSTEFIVMRSKPGLPPQLPYFLARSPRFRDHAIRNMVGSSGRQRVAAAQLANFPVRQAEPSELAAFGSAALLAFSHMKSLDAESRALAGLRDALLPRLMSGEIRVREAERAVEDAS